jgi:FkbM family methyltransferase
MIDPRAFDADFVYRPIDAAAQEPFYVIVDGSGDEFIIEFLKAARCPGRFLGKIDHPRKALDKNADIFVDPVTWLSRSEELHEAGAKVRILMYFHEDPTAFLDFAKACGQALGEVIRKRRLTPAAMQALTPYLETWATSRPVAGRVLPYTYYHVKDYAALVEANGARISKVLSCLADDESRADYSRLIYGTNEQHINAFMRKVFGFQQYNEIANIRPGMNIINCGVGSGNEVWYFLAKIKGIGNIYNFDPMCSIDSGRFGRAYLRYIDNLHNVAVLVGQNDGVVKAGIGEWGMIYTGDGLNKSADVEFPSARIDTLFRNGAIPRFHYLKMDVEGAELDILKGGMEAIKACRPMISVTIYHEAEHFWDYPLYLMEELENYRFYVRQYGYARFETLLYAIPDEDIGSLSGQEAPHLPVAADAPPKRTLLHSYLRDVLPRTGFNGKPVNVLTRADGASWETVKLTAGPEVHPDEVLCIIETRDAGTIVTRHEEGGKRLISVGAFADPTKLVWTAQHGASHRRFVPIFGAGPADPLFAEQDGSDGKVYGVFIRDATFDWTDLGEESRMILALSMQAGMPGRLLANADGQAVWVDAAGETTLSLPGSVEAVTSVSSIGETGLRRTIGIVVRRGGPVRDIYPLLPGGALGEAMQLETPELTIVPTTLRVT